MAPKGKKHSHAVISQTADNLLTGTYLFLVLYSLYTFWFTRDDHMDLAIFGACCAVVITAIKLTEFVATFVFRDTISKTLLNSGPHPDPLSKKKAFHKFIGTLWQLVIHVSMSAFEVYILWDESWLSHPYTCFQPFHYEPKFALRVFYILQIAIWIITCFSHRFNSDAHAHKDYVIMYVHHLVTIALVSISFAAGQTRIGLIVLFVHDISDIGIDFLKLSNYLVLEGLQQFLVVEVAYFTTMVCWFYYRLWYYPVYIIYHGPMWGLGLAGDSVHGHPPVRDTLSGDELAFQLNVGWTSLALLVTLFLMHIWWFFLLARIFLRLLETKDRHTAGAEEYEGESDEEDNDEEEEKQQEEKQQQKEQVVVEKQKKSRKDD